MHVCTEAVHMVTRTPRVYNPRSAALLCAEMVKQRGLAVGRLHLTARTCLTGPHLLPCESFSND